MTKDRVLDKLAKMKRLQEGEAALGHTEAAENFAAIINRMLIEHELDVADIPLGSDDVKIDEPIIEHVVSMDPKEGVPFVKARVAWQSALASIVARNSFCRYLVQTGTNRIWFVGTESHVKTAEYLFIVLIRAAEAMSIKARVQYFSEQRRLHGPGSVAQYGKGYRESWLQAFVQRIDERLSAERAQAVAASANASTALVRLNDPMLRVNDYMKQRGGKAAKLVKRRASSHSAGFHDGRKAADNMALHKGVGGSSRRLLK